MAYVVDEKGNAKTTLNVVVPTLHDMVVAGKDVIPLNNGGVAFVDKRTGELTIPTHLRFMYEGVG